MLKKILLFFTLIFFFMNPGEAGVIRDDINKYENTTISKVTGVLKDRVAEVYSRAKTGINKIGTA
ncbi:MAG: hypothetical protein WDW20_05100, partial [Neisseriaceae bacterium]